MGDALDCPAGGESLGGFGFHRGDYREYSWVDAGEGEIPEEWVERVEMREVVEEMGMKLFSFSR